MERCEIEPRRRPKTGHKMGREEGGGLAVVNRSTAGGHVQSRHDLKEVRYQKSKGNARVFEGFQQSTASDAVSGLEKSHMRKRGKGPRLPAFQRGRAMDIYPRG